MNLQDVIEKIRNLRLESLALDKDLYSKEVSVKRCKQIIESVKNGYANSIYNGGLDTYKTEKQKETALKDLMSVDENFKKSIREISDLEKDIFDIGIDKTELSIEIEYFKNHLRIAEIEVNAMKSGGIT